MKTVPRNWTVKVTSKAGNELAELLKSGALTEDDQIVIRQWAQTITQFGPEAVRDSASVWKDHELSAEWAGHRASSFSTRGRIIYKIEDRIIRVLVVRISATHDYEKENGK